MIETGKILKLYDKYHLLFQGSKGKYYIGKIADFGNLEIGKNISIELVKRYEALSIVKNSNGKYKLYDLTNSKTEFVPFLFFKNKETGEDIEVSLNKEDKNFNNNIIGDYYDLSIIEYYKGFNFVPNIPDNKTNENEEVLILSKRTESHYICLYRGKTIILTTKELLDEYIGKTILIDLYIKYLANNIQSGDKLYKGIIDKFTLNLTDGVNKLITNNSNNKDFILKCESKITSDNIGKKIDVEYYPLKYGDLNYFKESNKKDKGYQLLTLNQSKERFFRDVENDDVFACYFKNELQLDNKLGSIFSFIYYDYYLLINIIERSKKDNGKFYLQEIITNSNISIFIKDNIRYAINCKKFKIPESAIGDYFDIIIIPYIFGRIIDVEVN